LFLSSCSETPLVCDRRIGREKKFHSDVKQTLNIINLNIWSLRFCIADDHANIRKWKSCKHIPSFMRLFIFEYYSLVLLFVSTILSLTYFKSIL
jgi:hypothetical protein